MSQRRNRGQAGFFNRDKASLDIFRLRDESLEDSDNLPDPDVLAQEIVDDLEAALEQFREIANDLGSENPSKTH
jgi:type I restriction enzyme M protein